MEDLDNVIMNLQGSELKDEEQIVVYTEEKEPIGVISKKLYQKVNTLSFKGRKVYPWIECVTCFIVDPNDEKIAVELRGRNEIDAGMLDTVSGHVRYGEISKVAMAREMIEEVCMNTYTRSKIVEKLQFLGKVKADFSKNSSEKNNLRCFGKVYAFLIDDKEKLMANEEAVKKLVWANKEDVKNAIRSSMFRFPYDEQNQKEFEKIFENLDKLLEGKFFMGNEEYVRNWK